MISIDISNSLSIYRSIAGNGTLSGGGSHQIKCHTSRAIHAWV